MYICMCMCMCVYRNTRTYYAGSDEPAAVATGAAWRHVATKLSAQCSYASSKQRNAYMRGFILTMYVYVCKYICIE